MSKTRSLSLLASLTAFTLAAGPARAEGPPGFPEEVIQWGVQKGETCEDIAKALYGDGRHAHLAMRYNRVTCTRGAPLREGLTLVMPAKVTTIPTAVLRSMVPAVRAKPPGGGWGDATTGMPLSTNANVNTLEKASASIQFVDRTRVFLAENTLVVIFGTADQTAVTRNVTPPAVEVSSGEVRATLAALRGESAEVAVPGGGRVSAASRDTVIERKGERTTVAVFDGRASVKNGGKSVEVPLNFGTRFVGAAPPIAPRPLPSAPEWGSRPPEILLATRGRAVLEAGWKPVEKARAYRVELARDGAFEQLLTREETRADTTSFRAEGLPKGSYFLRVRAIDKEDFLGVAAAPVQVTVIDAVTSEGSLSLTAGELAVNAYVSLDLRTATPSRLALDDGPLVDNPGAIELGRTRPKALRLRVGASEATLALHYEEAKAVVAVRRASRRDEVRVSLTGLPRDVLAKVKPALIAVRAGQEERVTLNADPAVQDGLLGGLDDAAGVRAYVVRDQFGVELGRSAPVDDPAPDRKESGAALAPPPRIGLSAPAFGPNPYVVDWFSPTARASGSVGFALERDLVGGDLDGQGRLFASGAIGPVSLDGAVLSDDLSSPEQHHETAWLGGRVRVLRLGQSELELAPVARIGLGLGDASVLGMAGAAIGGVEGHFSWLCDVLFHFRPDAAAPYVPAFVGGVTFEPVPWLRTFATIDAFGADVADDARFGGGLSLGAEAGTFVYGHASARLSPFDAPLGGIGGTLAIGVREPR